MIAANPSVTLLNTSLQGIVIKAAVTAAIFITTLLLVRMSNNFFRRRINKAANDITQLNYLKHIFSGGIYIIGFTLIIFQIDYLKSIAISILASSGILAIIIGFASQQTFANIVSGLFISIFKPFRLGDRIRFINKDTAGIVEDITLRHTVIRTFENKRVIIPNNIINNEMIENASIIDERACNYLDIPISYDSDIRRAVNIMKEEALKHKDFFDNRTAEEIQAGEEPVPVKVVGFEDSTVNLRAWIWSKDPSSGFFMVCDLRQQVKEHFDQEGIQLPARCQCGNSSGRLKKS